MQGYLTRKQIGNLGEGIACNFLKKNGYEIVERNYWKKWGEIDVVAEKRGKTYFVEVKTVSWFNANVSRGTRGGKGDFVTRENNLSSTDDYRAEDNVHPWKLKRLSRTIQSYILEKRFPDSKEWQFDVITVVLDTTQKTAKIKVISDVVLS